MKENIQRPGEEVAIVFYDAPLPPKYFRFSKKFIRLLFVVIPTTLTIIFLTLFFWGLGMRLKYVSAPSIPQMLSDDHSKIQTLESELDALKKSNAELTDKLATQPAAITTEDPYLLAIRRPYGMQNLLQQNQVTLDQFDLVTDADKVVFKFKIISSGPETKVTGHVLVFMLSESGTMAWPREANTALGSGIKYSLGEPFSVSRLRPTNAEFLHYPAADSVHFVIYIFSREGDLLLIKETQAFEIKGKQ